MLRTIAWYIHFASSLALTIPKLNKIKVLESQGKTQEKAEYIHTTTSNWALSQAKMSGARVVVHGLENLPKDRAVVYVSNHESNFDIALFMSYIDRPKGFIAKIEIKKVPILRDWMEYLNCVFMDRHNMRKSAEAIMKGVKILKGGYSLVIFPEGTRSKSNNIGEFKAGSFKLATKAGVPIVPVTIKNSYMLMEKNRFKITPADVEMYIHEMVETSGLSREEEEKLPDKIKDIIKSSLS